MPETAQDMSEDHRPQLYLITPPAPAIETFPADLARVLDSVEVACLRLSMATTDEDQISRMADALREVTHARDVAIVIDRHALLVERLGLDGVHLSDGSRSVAKWRKALGEEAIVGAYCGASRHDGLTAGEVGADYVSFGPVGETSLGDGTVAEFETFEWWSQMIEVPCVAEGALTRELVEKLGPYSDFFAFSTEVWESADPVATLKNLVAPLGY